MLSLTLMLSALGYCITKEGVWPPPGSWLPPQPEITVRGYPSLDLSAARITDGARTVRLTASSGHREVVLTPSEPLSHGTWTLTGVPGHEDLSWTVRDPEPGGPTWSGEPRVVRASTGPSICAEMTFVVLDVPIAGASRQPLVEVTWTSPDQPGRSEVGRFRVANDRVQLHFGCDALGVGEQTAGQQVSLSIVGIDSLGQRSEPKVLTYALTAL